MANASRKELHWYIVVPQSGMANFSLAQSRGIWGAKRRELFSDPALGEIQPGDTIHFILSPQWGGNGPPPKGYPRVSLEQYNARADEVTAVVSSNVYEDASELWDDGLYPFRFRFTHAMRTTDIRLTPDAVSDDVRDAVRRSLITQGRAVPVPDSFSLSASFSRILTEYSDAVHQPYRQHSIVNLITKELPSGIGQVLGISRENYQIQGSVGQGNWSSVPWVAVLERRRGGTIRSGLYVAYLISSDLTNVVLALMFGVTRPGQGAQRMRRLEEDIKMVRDHINPDPSRWQIDNDLKLSDHGVGAQYRHGIVLYRSYPSNNLPDDAELLKDLRDIMDIYHQALGTMSGNELTERPESTAKESSATYRRQTFNLSEVHRFVSTMGYQIGADDLLNIMLSLQVRPFVIFFGRSGTGKTTLSRIIAHLFGWHYETIAVSPAWADPADLLGFFSPLTQQRVDGAMTRLMEYEGAPALVCLDEFNVAKVEHYLSDFISAMDNGTGANFWGTLPSLRRLLGRDDPPAVLTNLKMIATMNFDDSVQSITPRVLDRANVIEFEVSSADELIVGRSLDWALLKDQEIFQWPWVDNVTGEDLETQAIIRELWRSLQKSRGLFGHRVAQEFHRYVALGLPFASVLGRTEDQQRNGLVDNQIVQRLLPKFHGTASGHDIDALMQMLRVLLQLDGTAHDTEGRRTLIDDAYNRGVYPKTVSKINQLERSYVEDGYAFFW